MPRTAKKGRPIDPTVEALLRIFRDGDGSYGINNLDGYRSLLEAIPTASPAAKKQIEFLQSVFVYMAPRIKDLEQADVALGITHGLEVLGELLHCKL